MTIQRYANRQKPHSKSGADTTMSHYCASPSSCTRSNGTNSNSAHNNNTSMSWSLLPSSLPEAAASSASSSTSSSTSSSSSSSSSSTTSLGLAPILVTNRKRQSSAEQPLAVTRRRPCVERWILPSGAEQIIRQIAAEQILHELLDRCCCHDGNDGDQQQPAGHEDIDHNNTNNNNTNNNNGEGKQQQQQSQTTTKDNHHNDSNHSNSTTATMVTTTTIKSSPFGSASSPVDFSGIEGVVREFPGTCRRTYEFHVDTRDQANRVRSLLPLAILCCLNPPLSTVQAVYHANPEAIVSLDPAKGATPLLYACSFEASLDVVNFLIAQYPESVRIPRTDGAIPLAMACSYKAPPAVVDRLIQEYPQGIQQSSVEGWFPIHAAVACEAPVLAIQQLYQAFPESVTNTQNATQSTALHLACSKRASLDVVEFLLQVAPQCLALEDSKRMTPWFWAVYTQTLPVIQLLMRQYPELPHQSPDGIYLLHFAARHNTPDVVDYLAQRFPSMVSARTRPNGMTPLHTACRRGRPLAVIQALVRHNPRCLFIRNQRGRFPLDEAREANACATVIDYLVHEQRARRAWWW